MKNFLKDNITPIIVGAVISLFAFLTFEVIRNTARIDALSHDLNEIKISLREIVKILMKDEK